MNDYTSWKNELARLIDNPRLKFQVLRNLIQLEKEEGHRIAEAAYRLRFVRLAGIDPFDDLINACVLVNNEQMPGAANYLAKVVLSGEYKSSERSQKLAGELLQNMTVEDVKENAIVKEIDTRLKKKYKLACIISIYKEENLLEKCIRRLAMQSLYQKGELEVILVDSASPENEWQIVDRLKNEIEHLLYIKTEKRESLPKALNRGVRCSSGEFITFTAPSNFFVDNAFESLLEPFSEHPDVCVVQGDIGEPFSEYPKTSVPLSSKDMKRFTRRRNDSLNQLRPFVYSNYLAFDSAIFRRTVGEEIGFFDEGLICAAEIKFLLQLLKKGQLYQLGEVVESSYEAKGPRLTVHPRVEVELFVAMHQCFTKDDLLEAAKQDDLTLNDMPSKVYQRMVSLSLRYENPYTPFSDYSFYDLEAARKAAEFALESDPDSSENWNNFAVLQLRQTVSRASAYIDFSGHLISYHKYKNWFNRMILSVIRWVASWTLLTVPPVRLRPERKSTIAIVGIRKVSNRLRRIFNRNRTYDSDMFGGVVW